MEKLILSALIPVVLSAGCYLLNKKTPFGDKPYWMCQAAIGVLFGLSAMFATDHGVDIGNAIVNVRDASPLCAGLLFGGPAGILSGLIGGAYRYFFGPGDYTRVACSLAVILCGVLGATLRWIMFDNKRSPWIYGLGIGIVGEILHMLLILLTNIDNLQTAFAFLDRCSVIMIVAVGLIVMTAGAVTGLLSGEIQKARRDRQKELSLSFQFWLLVCVLIAFLVTCLLSFRVQSGIAVREAEENLRLNLEDICKDVDEVAGGVEEVLGYAPSWRVGKNGGVIVCDDQLVILTGPEQGERLAETDIFGDRQEQEADTCFEIEVYGTPSYCMYTKYKGLYYIAYLPMSEIMYYRKISLYMTVFTEVLIFAALFFLIYLLTKRLVVDNLRKVNRSLAEITGGNLEEKVQVRDYREFASLSDDINSTVSALKGYIAEAAARIDKELEFARTIQHSMLPSIFPPYPERKEFEIFARMDAAKEVGGDFYDFYFVGENRLGFLIADVSGKGIPAAMFMMTAKTTIKNLAESGMPVEQVFECANQRLCENNEADMFVTVWMGILDIRTGTVTFANAGHNPPLIRHGCHGERSGEKDGGEKGEGGFEYFHSKPGFVLAGMEDMSYKSGTIQLAPGDVIYLYTDGVTEAINRKEELFGENRLRDLLSSAGEISMQNLCGRVCHAVNSFVGDVPQFDDMTMLALKWNGKMENESV